MDGMDSPGAASAPTGAQSRASNGGKDTRKANDTLDHYSSAIKSNVAAGAPHLAAARATNPTHSGFLAAQSKGAATTPLAQPQMLTKPGSLDFVRPGSK